MQDARSALFNIAKLYTMSKSGASYLSSFRPSSIRAQVGNFSVLRESNRSNSKSMSRSKRPNATPRAQNSSYNRLAAATQLEFQKKIDTSIAEFRKQIAEFRKQIAVLQNRIERLERQNMNRV